MLPVARWPFRPLPAERSKAPHIPRELEWLPPLHSHRLQLLFDLQTHRLPEGEEELRKLALRMGYHQEGIEDRGQRIGDRAVISNQLSVITGTD